MGRCERTGENMNLNCLQHKHSFNYRDSENKLLPREEHLKVKCSNCGLTMEEVIQKIIKDTKEGKLSGSIQ